MTELNKKMVSTTQESLEITDGLPEETPEQSFERKKNNHQTHTEKNVDEVEAEFQKDIHQKTEPLSEIEKKRLLRKIEIEQSIAAFEESEREKERKLAFSKQMNKIKEASMRQLEKMQERETKYRGELEQSLTKGEDTTQLSKHYMEDQEALLYHHDSISMDVSMTINDALQNTTLDENHNPTMSVKEHIFGRTAHGRQKTVLINGQPVMLDESVAHAIQAQRSPLLAGHFVASAEQNFVMAKDSDFVYPLHTREAKQFSQYRLEFDQMMNQLDTDRTQMIGFIQNTYPIANQLQYTHGKHSMDEEEMEDEQEEKLDGKSKLHQDEVDFCFE